VRLEVLPKAHYFHYQGKVDFYELFITEVAQLVPVSEALISQAHLEAQSAGLGALDALHVAAAKISGAEEFVTTKRLTTALCRVVGLMITTIRPTTRL
jgi:predicted nucleic acid-binding protein